MTLKEYIIKLLEIVGYQEDKGLYADKLILIFQGKAVALVLKELDQERKDRINELTKDEKEVGKIFNIFRNELKQAEVEISFARVVQEELPKIVKEFADSSSQTIKEEINKYIESSPRFF